MLVCEREREKEIDQYESITSNTIAGGLKQVREKIRAIVSTMTFSRCITQAKYTNNFTVKTIICYLGSTTECPTLCISKLTCFGVSSYS